MTDWNGPRIALGAAREGDPRPHFALRSPYSESFVIRLKQRVAAADRVWLPTSERWLIAEGQLPKVQRLVLQMWAELLVHYPDGREEIVTRDGSRIEQGRLF